VEEVRVDVPAQVFGNPVEHFARKADVLRLQILLEHGGIYLDLDTICQRSFEPLLDGGVVMGREERILPDRSRSSQRLCNATIIAPPGPVIEEPWRDFAYNRSLPLKSLRQRRGIDYALIIDADDVIVYESGFDAAAFKAELTADLYHAGAARVKDLLEERLFECRRDLFSDLSLVFMDTSSLSFYDAGGGSLGACGHSKDHRADLKQMILAVVIDSDGRQVGAARYVLCRNEAEAEWERHEGQAIIAGLARQLARGHKALIGNSAYRRYLRRTPSASGKPGPAFEIDPGKLAEEARYDGLFVLRTNARITPLQAVLRYRDRKRPV
jgi:hypothetical protein